MMPDSSRKHFITIFLYEIDNIRVDLIPCYLFGIIRIPHKHIALFYSVHKPFGIECGDIRPHSSLQYHKRSIAPIGQFPKQAPQCRQLFCGAPFSSTVARLSTPTSCIFFKQFFASILKPSFNYQCPALIIPLSTIFHL